MKRKGFTLVELLIVIAILGALTSMMSLSGTNATASANATKIVNNLQTLKTAAIMFYNDYIYSGDAGITTESFIAQSADYFDPAILKDLRSNYAIFMTTGTATTASKWYAIYKFDNVVEEDKIRTLLAARAEKFGLLKATNLTTVPTDNGTYFVASSTTKSGNKPTTTAATAVAIRVR